MKKINFAEGNWNPQDFRCVYSPRWIAGTKPKQENDCITNGINPTNGEYDYVSLMTEEKYKTGVRLETTCSFDSFGAPLIVISDDMFKREDGEWYFGIHYEIVLYEKGINVWEINYNPDVMEWHKVMGLDFLVSEKEPHTFSVKVLDKMLDITMGEQHVLLRMKHLPEEFHVGITLCEGINRFYEFGIE